MLCLLLLFVAVLTYNITSLYIRPKNNTFIHMVYYIAHSFFFVNVFFVNVFFVRTLYMLLIVCCTCCLLIVHIMLLLLAVAVAVLTSNIISLYIRPKNNTCIYPYGILSCA
jgi:hypothetical protein